MLIYFCKGVAGIRAGNDTEAKGPNKELHGQAGYELTILTSENARDLPPCSCVHGGAGFVYSSQQSLGQRGAHVSHEPHWTAERQNMIYVLVHGGWHGGWCWDAVAERLRRQGHEVWAPTLTGLAERQHLHHAVTGPQTHVDDITTLLTFHDLSDVVLVGHSYGGLIITGVAAAMPERIASLVYLDAFVPTMTGQAASDMANPERAAEIQKAIQADGTMLPTGFHRWVAAPEAIALLQARCTPHPGVCFGQGVTLTGGERQINRRSFILCEHHQPSPFWQFYERYKDDPAWDVHRLPCLHNAMMEMPDALTDLLLGAGH